VLTSGIFNGANLGGDFWRGWGNGGNLGLGGNDRRGRGR